MSRRKKAPLPLRLSRAILTAIKPIQEEAKDLGWMTKGEFAAYAEGYQDATRAITFAITSALEETTFREAIESGKVRSVRTYRFKRHLQPPP